MHRERLSRYAVFALCSLVVTALLTGCAPSVQYNVSAVAQENPASIARITNDADSVAGCKVYWKGKSWLYDARNRISIANNGSAVAYMTMRGLHYGIAVRGLDSTTTIQKKLPFGAIDPCFAPDNKRIAFARNVRGAWNIYETSLDSVPTIKRLTGESGINIYPRYTSDNCVLFNHIELSPGKDIPAVDGQLWKTDPAGMVMYGSGFAPVPVPKTGAIVAVRYNAQQSTTELWRIDLATGTEYMLFGKPGWGALDPSISPDGSMIAFVAMTEQKKLRTNLDIYTINIDGSNLTQRTFFTGNDICPRWDASGKALYFISQRGNEKGQWNIWKMQLTLADTAVPPVPVAVADTQKTNSTAVVATSAKADTVAADTNKAVKADSTSALPGKEDISGVLLGSTITVTDSSGTAITGKVIFVGKKGVMINVNGENRSLLRDDIRSWVPAEPSPATGNEGGKQ